MKKFASNISVALLLAVYLAAFAGFKTHECSDDHSVEVLSVLADDDCEQLHGGHHHCEGHLPEADGALDPSVSESDCCHNSVHALFSEQITDDNDVEGGMFTPTHSSPQPLYRSSGVAFGRMAINNASQLKPSGRCMLALYSVARA